MPSPFGPKVAPSASLAQWQTPGGRVPGAVANVVGIRRGAISGKVEDTVSGCEVNRLIAELRGERLPAIDLTHVDLTGGEQRPEQHGGGVGGR